MNVDDFIDAVGYELDKTPSADVRIYHYENKAIVVIQALRYEISFDFIWNCDEDDVIEFAQYLIQQYRQMMYSRLLTPFIS